jgi:hypothetical protein
VKRIKKKKPNQVINWLTKKKKKKPAEVVAMSSTRVNMSHHPHRL